MKALGRQVGTWPAAIRLCVEPMREGLWWPPAVLCPWPLRQPGLERGFCALPISKELGYLRKNLLGKGLLLVAFLDYRKPLGSASCENAQILSGRYSHQVQADKASVRGTEERRRSGRFCAPRV